MLSILVADDNLAYATTLINYIMDKSKEMRLVAIAQTGKEVIQILEKKTIDLILLDLQMPNGNGIEVLKVIKKMENKEKVPKIMIISGETDLLQKIGYDSLVVEYANKAEGMEAIYQKIAKIAWKENKRKNNSIVKKEVTTELLQIGFNYKHKGTQYLYESIMYIYQAGDRRMLDNLENYVYKVVGAEHGTNVRMIKSNILKATNYMYVETSFEKLKEHLFLVEDKKPTPKLIISIILRKLDDKYDIFDNLMG